MLALMQLLIVGALVAYVWKHRDKLAAAHSFSVPAGALARRLGLALVEGDPDADLVFRYVLLRDVSRSLRMVGQRQGRPVELAQRVRVVHRHDWVRGEHETECAIDGHLTMDVRSPVSFEIVHRLGGELASRSVMQPILTLGIPEIDRRLEIRAADGAVFRALLPELDALAAMPVAHVTCTDGRLSLRESRASSALALNAEKALPILERIAAELEGTRIVDDDGPTVAMPGPTFAPVDVPVTQGSLGCDVRTLASSLGARIRAVLVTGVFAWIALVCFVDAIEHHSLHALLASGVCVLFALAGVAYTAAVFVRRVTLRQYGFEWRGLLDSGSARYADVRNPRLAAGRRGVWVFVTLSFETGRVTHRVHNLDGLDELHNAIRGAAR